MRLVNIARKINEISENLPNCVLSGIDTPGATLKAWRLAAPAALVTPEIAIMDVIRSPHGVSAYSRIQPTIVITDASESAATERAAALFETDHPA